MTQIQKLREEFRQPAQALAAQLSGPTPKPRPKASGWTERAVWFRQPGRLIAAVGEHEERHVGEVLAHGLFHRGTDELVLVLPLQHVQPTLRRLAWLKVPIRIYAHNGVTPTEVDTPDRQSVIDSVESDTDHPALHLGDRTPWVEPLMRWAGEHHHLDASHRGDTRAWQCRGLRVLTIRRTRTGLLVRAGIHSTSGGGAPLQLSGPLTSSELAELKNQVGDAVQERLAGGSYPPDEHWFQAVLRRHPELLHLEQPVLREVPAWRPVGGAYDGQPSWGRGFIDLAGLDAVGNLQLVETKVAADPMLVLQSLDYFTWAQREAHLARLAQRLGCHPRADLLRLHLVIGAGPSNTGQLDRYAAATLDALAADVPWAISIADDWQAPDARPNLRHYPAQHKPPSN